jgi:hypothetical protein
MNLKKTHGEFLDKYDGLDKGMKIEKTLPSQLSYWLSRIKDRLAVIIRKVEAARRPLDELDKELIRYITDHADKDPDGRPLVVELPGGSRAYKGIKENDPEIVAFKSKRDGLADNLEKLMEEEIELELFSIPFKLFPKEINPQIMDAVVLLVTDGPEEGKDASK